MMISITQLPLPIVQPRTTICPPHQLEVFKVGPIKLSILFFESSKRANSNLNRRHFTNLIAYDLIGGVVAHLNFALLLCFKICFHTR